jgi:hypothetical protein
MANEEMVREALIRLMQTADIEVRGQKGGSKRVDSIQPDDVIKPGNAPMLIPVARPPTKRNQ